MLYYSCTCIQCISGDVAIHPVTTEFLNSNYASGTF